jgi:hypothetical protein
MISTFFAGLSILLFLGVSNTYMSHLLFVEIKAQTGKNNS